jgi:glycerol-3-phosphate acyltransferase PlsY
MILPVTIAGFAGYLLGSLPFGYLVARAHGVNIFQVGSKNPGATNVRRVLGKKAGTTVLILDAAKGALATALPLLAMLFLRPAGDPTASWDYSVGGTVVIDSASIGYMQLAAMAGSLLGHSFSVFTGFRGGKGVATGAGGYLVLVPLAGLIAGTVWVLVFFASRYVSLASILAAASVPASAWALGRGSVVIALSIVIAAFVIFRHRENVRRLLNGTESRFVRKPSGSA